VAIAVERGVALGSVAPAEASAIHPAMDESALRALEPAAAVAAKESIGGTGPRSVGAQLAWLTGRAGELAAKAAEHGSIDALATRVFAEPLESP
jgi:argininosuccinate lyase